MVALLILPKLLPWAHDVLGDRQLKRVFQCRHRSNRLYKRLQKVCKILKNCLDLEDKANRGNPHNHKDQSLSFGELFDDPDDLISLTVVFKKHGAP